MVSVCIPTKNAGSEFARNLRAWREQRLDEKIELIVVDSGSGDATVETARALGARVLTIPPSDYNHGETRNLLARHARGDILVFTVQDATPASRRVLEPLSRPLRENPSLSAVTGKEIPQPNADFVARWEAQQLSRQIDKSQRLKRLGSLQEFFSWDLSRRFEYVAFDNVCSAIRRRVWECFPFARLEFGEDLDWAFRVLRSRETILYNPEAQVQHSHNWPPSQRLKRYFVGKRSTNHILHMPAEYSFLTDKEAARVIDEFSSWVGRFCRSWLRRHLLPLLPGLLDTVAPDAPRSPGLRTAREFMQHKPTQRLQLKFARVWWQVGRYNGRIPPREVEHVAQQLEAMLVGDFLGSYYHTCQLEDRVSPELRELAQRLGTDP